MKKVSIVGIICLIIAVIVLFMSFKINKDLNGKLQIASKDAIELKDSTILDKNEGKLVILTGKLSLENEFVSDDELGVKVKTLSLLRNVEMYQWEEDEIEQEDLDENPEYEYFAIWSNKLIDSSEYHRSGYNNPKEMPYESKSFYNKLVIGDFTVSNKLISKLNTKALNEVESTNTYDTGLVVDEQYLTSVYSREPHVRDIRISYKYVDISKVTDITILAKQVGNTFVEYTYDDQVLGDMWLEKLSKNQVIEKISEKNTTSRITMYALIGVFTILGIALIMRKRKSV